MVSILRKLNVAISYKFYFIAITEWTCGSNSSILCRSLLSIEVYNLISTSGLEYSAFSGSLVYMQDGRM